VSHNTDVIGSYLCELARIPALTEEEEQQLRGRIRSGDDAARTRLIEGTLLFAFFIARRHARRVGNCYLQDLVSEANLAVTQLGLSFDPDHPYPFKSCAYFRVRQALALARHRLVQPVRIPDPLRRIEREQLQARQALRQQLRREPTRGEIANELDLPLARIEETPETRGVQLDLDSPGVGALAATDPSPEEISMEDSSASLVRSALGNLNESQRETVERHFGLDTGQPASFAEIAAARGVSRQRIHQQCHAAMRRLGHTLRHFRRAAAL
jgi:RNA polymerase primary sigma factor